MGEEKEAVYYDDVFRASETYKQNYLHLDRFLIFVRIRQWLILCEDYPIIEIGCGTGQLAEYLESEGFTNYIGLDFSEEALKIARTMSNQTFIYHDLRNGLQKFINEIKLEENQKIIFIATAVLEHIKEDIKLLEEFPKNNIFIFSVPKFDDDGHVRFFQHPKEVENRYSNRLQFDGITKIDDRLIFLSPTKRKSKNVVYE